MPTIHTDLPAVVLDSRDHGESDKIITLFCKDIGKLTGIAKGAHRSKKRFVNKLELFSFLSITCSRSTNAGLAVITDGELLNGFMTIRSSVPQYQAASVIREFILLATNEQLPENELFILLLWTLHALDRGESCSSTTAIFLIKFFDSIGYRPDFSCCQNCGLMYQNKSPAVFSNQAGGLICSRCMSAGTFSGRKLSTGTIKVINAIQNQPIRKLQRLKLSGPILDDLLNSAYRYGRHLFQREIVSWKFFSADLNRPSPHHR
ncbi:MAG: DNA repair protein RecO [Desulfocapsaceae bacterium]|jgi:DNA repair protein RecO (recombination protein O)|nr:DNA repair protein RecO [Desulfocapsaceae bacterium]